MGRKKKAAPKFEAWCWYCDRDFADEKVLLQHQRAKHYRCPYCPRRLNTSGGLTVHLHQVHKAEPTTIENALPGRESFDTEIYGMVGIPEADLAEWQARKEKRGQGDGGHGGLNGASKRPKIDKGVIPIEQLKLQLEAHKALMSGKAPPPGFGFGGPIAFPPPSFHVPPPGFTGGRPPPPSMSPHQPPPFGVPPPPGAAIPPFGGPPPGYPYAPPPSWPIAAATSARNAATSLPTFNPHEQAVKQGAKTRMVYTDVQVSPEEKLATISKYRYIDPNEAQQPSSSQAPPPGLFSYPPPNYSVPPPGFTPPIHGGRAFGSPYNAAATATPTPPPPAQPQAQAQSYPSAMISQGLPAAVDPQANTAEALADVNSSVSAQELQQREAEMEHMQAQGGTAKANNDAVSEPVGVTEAALTSSSDSVPTRSGRKRASDLF